MQSLTLLLKKCVKPFKCLKRVFSSCITSHDEIPEIYTSKNLIYAPYFSQQLRKCRW